jgi:malonate-semialdehyde dehydrogenase (acetylating) / methylmalonate-semialdehyde dehydrogenase
VKLRNFVGGEWRDSAASDWKEVHNPATNEVIALAPLSTPEETEEAIALAEVGFLEWRNVPAPSRVQPMFRLKNLLEEHFEEIARSITIENGKTLDDSHGEVRRIIENVETACGIPTMMLGDFSENIARGIDEYMIRQPMGVCVHLCPFNFPGMVPFWFLPYALACGNSAIVKPSMRTPMTLQLIFQLFEQCGFPKGAVTLLHGGHSTVDTLLDHPVVKAVTFVGSTETGLHVYKRASAAGKRVQAQGGARNAMVIMPDATVQQTANIVTESAFGNAGQRCLAGSLAVTVGEADRLFRPVLAEVAAARPTGFGLDPGVQTGPVITPQSLARIEGLVQQGLDEGATMLVDGRKPNIKGYERGNFMRPTILADVVPTGDFAKTEVFGPVLGVIHVDTLDEAIAFSNGLEYGNMGCIFTSSGSAARKFRHEIDCGNVGINIGVAAPMSFFPFSGWKHSFFGTLHGQGNHAIEFFTQTKVVIERWHSEWTRKF